MVIRNQETKKVVCSLILDTQYENDIRVLLGKVKDSHRDHGLSVIPVGCGHVDYLPWKQRDETPWEALHGELHEEASGSWGLRAYSKNVYEKAKSLLEEKFGTDENLSIFEKAVDKGWCSNHHIRHAVQNKAKYYEIVRDGRMGEISMQLKEEVVTPWITFPYKDGEAYVYLTELISIPHKPSRIQASDTEYEYTRWVSQHRLEKNPAFLRKNKYESAEIPESVRALSLSGIRGYQDIISLKRKYGFSLPTIPVSKGYSWGSQVEKAPRFLQPDDSLQFTYSAAS
ncbi:hypothetical protein KW805_00280 [Candidatus Pacearchaeota archaeon]|nr:hypothetical protein [Candidatus Pacearchaeota archaeon]